MHPFISSLVEVKPLWDRQEARPALLCHPTPTPKEPASSLLRGRPGLASSVSSLPAPPMTLAQSQTRPLLSLRTEHTLGWKEHFQPKDWFFLGLSSGAKDCALGVTVDKTRYWASCEHLDAQDTTSSLWVFSRKPLR